MTGKGKSTKQQGEKAITADEIQLLWEQLEDGTLGAEGKELQKIIQEKSTGIGMRFNRLAQWDPDVQQKFLRVLVGTLSTSESEFAEMKQALLTEALESNLIDYFASNRISGLAAEAEKRTEQYALLVDHFVQILCMGFEVLPTEMSRHLKAVNSVLSELGGVSLGNFLRPTTVENLKRLKTLKDACSHGLVGGDPNRIGKWKLEDFEEGRKLGKGSFGIVFLGRQKANRIFVAIKVFHKKRVEQLGAQRSINREIQIQTRLSHPNILTLYTHFEDETKIYFVLEYAQKGQLREILKREGKFEEKRAARYMCQISDAMCYVHSRDIIHKDLRAEKILLTHTDQIKITGFVSASQKNSPNERVQSYMAPELLVHGLENPWASVPHDRSVDSWSAGVLCYELLTGVSPFATVTKTLIGKLPDDAHSLLSPAALDLIQNLLQLVPRDRLPFSGLLKHDWITANAPQIRPATMAEDGSLEELLPTPGVSLDGADKNNGKSE